MDLKLVNIFYPYIYTPRLYISMLSYAQVRSHWWTTTGFGSSTADCEYSDVCLCRHAHSISVTNEWEMRLHRSWSMIACLCLHAVACVHIYIYTCIYIFISTRSDMQSRRNHSGHRSSTEDFVYMHILSQRPMNGKWDSPPPKVDRWLSVFVDVAFMVG